MNYVRMRKITSSGRITDTIECMVTILSSISSKRNRNSEW